MDHLDHQSRVDQFGEREIPEASVSSCVVSICRHPDFEIDETLIEDVQQPDHRRHQLVGHQTTNYESEPFESPFVAVVPMNP
jgi:hypothetical protein